jgi:hypothetical protein
VKRSAQDVVKFFAASIVKKLNVNGVLSLKKRKLKKNIRNSRKRDITKMNLTEACEVSKRDKKEFTRSFKTDVRYKVIGNALMWKDTLRNHDWEKTSICSVEFLNYDFTIISVPKTGWINIYVKGGQPATQTLIHSTKEQAFDYRCTTAGYVDTVKIEWTE